MEAWAWTFLPACTHHAYSTFTDAHVHVIFMRISQPLQKVAANPLISATAMK